MVLGLIGKGIKSGVRNPALGGAVIGAGAGYFGSDYNKRSHTLEATFEGAFYGAVLGGAAGGLAKYGPGLARRASSTAISKGGIGSTIRSGGNVAKAAGRFVEKHPTLTATAAIGGGGVMLVAPMLGGEELAEDSPTLGGAKVNMRFNEQAVAAEQMMMSTVAPMGMVGTANQMMGPMQRRFQESTTGLVQGLHTSRH